MFSPKILLVLAGLVALAAAVPPFYRSPFQHYYTFPHNHHHYYDRSAMMPKSDVSIFNKPMGTFLRSPYYNQFDFNQYPYNQYYNQYYDLGYFYNFPQYY